jgi:hypothetical protein
MPTIQNKYAVYCVFTVTLCAALGGMGQELTELGLPRAAHIAGAAIMILGTLALAVSKALPSLTPPKG